MVQAISALFPQSLDLISLDGQPIPARIHLREQQAILQTPKHLSLLRRVDAASGGDEARGGHCTGFASIRPNNKMIEIHMKGADEHKHFTLNKVIEECYLANGKPYLVKLKFCEE